MVNFVDKNNERFGFFKYGGKAWRKNIAASSRASESPKNRLDMSIKTLLKSLFIGY
jgi:hypothetical protein